MVDHLPENRRLGMDGLGGLSLIHPQRPESINERQIDLDQERPAQLRGDLPHQLEGVAILRERSLRAALAYEEGIVGTNSLVECDLVAVEIEVALDHAPLDLQGSFCGLGCIGGLERPPHLAAVHLDVDPPGVTASPDAGMIADLERAAIVGSLLVAISHWDAFR